MDGGDAVVVAVKTSNVLASMTSSMTSTISVNMTSPMTRAWLKAIKDDSSELKKVMAKRKSDEALDICEEQKASRQNVAAAQYRQAVSVNKKWGAT